MDRKRLCFVLLAVTVVLLGATLVRYELGKAQKSISAGQGSGGGPDRRTEADAGENDSVADGRSAGGAGVPENSEKVASQSADEPENGDTIVSQPAGDADAPENSSTVGNLPAIDAAEYTLADPESGSGGQVVDASSLRVLLRSDSYEGDYHTEETVLFQSAYTCTTDTGASFQCEAGSTFSFPEEGPEGEAREWLFEPDGEGGSFSLPLLKRGYDSPVYHGSLTVKSTEEGYLLINTVDLETYLCGVVPSEMPAGYPLEALKAQAVCARTYALSHLSSERMGDLGADLDDSVSFQVYNNLPPDERSTRAVEETKGIVLMKNGTLAEAWYYSTSCGLDLTRDLSEEAVFCAFLAENGKEDWEKDEPWYRWNTSFTLEELTALAEDAGLTVGNVESLTVAEREESGRVSALKVEGDKDSAEVTGEYAIRKLLAPSETPVTRQDGSTAASSGMLPSAFFYLTKERGEEGNTGYQVIGGGYGHGNGMSQNGAMHMAEAGNDFETILKYYYGEVQLYDQSS